MRTFFVFTLTVALVLFCGSSLVAQETTDTITGFVRESDLIRIPPPPATAGLEIAQPPISPARFDSREPLARRI